MTEATLSLGDVVKFAKPYSEAEAAERYEVIELRGDRVLVAYLGMVNMPIVPTTVFLVADLVKA